MGITTNGLNPGAWGFPHVVGRCPACGAKSLFLAVGGYVTCSVLGCPDPSAVTNLLAVDPRAADSHPKAES